MPKGAGAGIDPKTSDGSRVLVGDEQKAPSWMRTPLPILDQHSPEQYGDSNVPEKQREVLRILGAIDYGMYS